MRPVLLQFSVENFLSLHKRQTLSLVASSLKDSDIGLIDAPTVLKNKVLPAVVIYGPNASGKSNLIEALHFMRDRILFSHHKGSVGEKTGRTPFALNKEAANSTTSFELDFAVDGVRYQYGFVMNDTAYLREWLYTFPKNRMKVLFSRKGTVIKFNRRDLPGRNRVIGDLTRANSLFISAAAQNGHKLLSKIVESINDIFGDMRAWFDGPDVMTHAEEVEKDNRVMEFLSSIGTGIFELQKKEEDISEKSLAFRQELNSLFKKQFGQDAAALTDVPDKKRTLVELGHRASDGSTVYLPFDAESSGTKRLLTLLNPVFRALDLGSVIVIDELSNSLHTKACEMLVALFCNSETNPRGAQLIATTHDTNLLQSDFLRRDQVWFAEKNEVGETHIYPLTDIRTRKSDDISKGYLQGRFGAYPYSGNIRRFVRK